MLQFLLLFPVKKTLKIKKQQRRSRGNTREQQKRRKERNKHRIQRRSEAVYLIDGNLSHYPVAFCPVHQGYVTQGLIDTHRCIQRKCKQLKMLYENENRTDQDQPS